MSSEKIFLYTTGGRTLWVPGHTPSQDEKKPVHILQIASPRELTRSFYLFDFPVRLFESPHDAAMTPGGKTPEEVIKAVNDFRRICSEDQQFLMQHCYDPHKPLPAAQPAAIPNMPQGVPPMQQAQLSMPVHQQQPAPPFHQHHQLHHHQHYQHHHQHQHHQHRAEHRQERQQMALQQGRPPSFHHPFSPAATNNRAMLTYLMEQYHQPNMKQVASPLRQPPPTMQSGLPQLGAPVGNPRIPQLKRGGQGVPSPVEGTRIEQPEPLPLTLPEVPQDILDAYMNPDQLLVLAVLPVLHITVWLRTNKLPQEKSEGRVLNCKGFKVFLRATSEDVADFKPVEVLGYQICMYYLLHNYCARHDCLHHHHTVKQLRYLLAAKHVELEGMSTKERKELSIQIATREKSRLEALKKERELKRLVKESTRRHNKPSPETNPPDQDTEGNSRKPVTRKTEEKKKLINIGLTDSGEDEEDDKEISSSPYSSHHSVVSAENVDNHVAESPNLGLDERPPPALPKLVMSLSGPVDTPSIQTPIPNEQHEVEETTRAMTTDVSSSGVIVEDIKGEPRQPENEDNLHENEQSNNNNNNGDDDDEDVEDEQSGDDKAETWGQNLKSKPKPKGKGGKAGQKRGRSPAQKKNTRTAISKK